MPYWELREPDRSGSPGWDGSVRVNYSYTQSIANNTSTVTITSIQFCSENHYQTAFTIYGRFTIGNTNYDSSGGSVYVSAQNTWYNIWSGSISFTVNHSTDGSGSFSIYMGPVPGSGYSDYNILSQYKSSGNIEFPASTYTVSLPKINRQFLLGISQGTNTTVVVNRTASPLGGSIGRLYNGGTLYYGDTITVSYSVGTGCNIYVHTVNNVTFSSGTQYTVQSNITVITTATVNSFTLTKTQGSNTTLTINRTSSPKAGAAQGYLNNGATIYYGDVLSISYSANTGYNISSAKLNGSNFNSGVTHTVTAAVTVVTSATVKTFTITRNVGTGLRLTINRTSSPNGGGATGIITGNTVYYGDVLVLTASANAGYNIEVMSINGTAYSDNPHTVTVTSALVIRIGSKALGFVHIDSGASIEKYKIMIDSGAAYEQYRAMIDTGSAIVPY